MVPLSAEWRIDEEDIEYLAGLFGLDVDDVEKVLAGLASMGLVVACGPDYSGPYRLKHETLNQVS